jgi:hypothetical protein
VAADQPAEQPAAEAVAEVEVALEDDFPVTLSEADEIHEETTAPIELTPAEEVALEVETADIELLRADVEVSTFEAEPGPPAAKAEPAAADWLAHPDAAAGDATPAASWEEATYPGESTLESAFAAAEAAQVSAAGTEVELAAELAPTAPGALDAWGEPTAPPPPGSSEIEPWAAPVDTPWEGNSRAAADVPSPGPEAAEIVSPSEVVELTEEPPEPDWARDPRELFRPLEKGEILSDEAPPPAFEPMSPEAATASPFERITPRQLELVREPETLESSDLLVPVEEAMPPVGVTPVEAAPVLVVPGEQRVAIHMRAGQTLRGTVTDLDLLQPQIPLEPQGGGPTENIDHHEVKAIFFMLAPGEKAEQALGQAVRITFSDGRTIEGHRQGDESPDGFFFVPLDAQRTNTRRIYVARDAVSDVVELPQ